MEETFNLSSDRLLDDDDVFRKIIKYKIQSKYFPWQLSCSTRTDGQTEMTKLIVTIRNFAN